MKNWEFYEGELREYSFSFAMKNNQGGEKAWLNTKHTN